MGNLMNWAAHPPERVQQVDETISCCRALPSTGTRRNKSKVKKYILHRCNSLCHVQPFQLVNPHCRCKAVQSGSGSVTGCHLYTLEHRGSSEQGEAEHPATCLGRIGSRLLPQKYSSAGPPFSSCKTGLPRWGAAHCWHSYMVCETPNRFLSPAPCHAAWLRPSQPVPSPASCQLGGESPMLQHGSWASCREALYPQKGA